MLTSDFLLFFAPISKNTVSLQKNIELYHGNIIRGVQYFRTQGITFWHNRGASIITKTKRIPKHT
jgi:hypothetical protein